MAQSALFLSQRCLIQELFPSLKVKGAPEARGAQSAMASKQEPESQLSRQTQYRWALRVAVEGPQGLQCIKQMVTSPKPQQGCPNSRNMGSSPMLREVNTYGKSFREKSFTARPTNAGGKVSDLSPIQEPGCN